MISAASTKYELVGEFDQHRLIFSTPRKQVTSERVLFSVSSVLRVIRLPLRVVHPDMLATSTVVVERHMPKTP